MTRRPSTPAEPGAPASGTTASHPPSDPPEPPARSDEDGPEANPLPNPPPGPGDYVPSRVVTAGGALRRSLLIWGWGQLAAGDRRGWLGPPTQTVAVAGLVAVAPLAGGTAAPIVFVLAAALVTGWAAIGVHAWHRAAHRRAALGVDPGGGAGALLWLAPLVLTAGAGLWVAGGSGADPALALDGYLGDWHAGRAEAASARFADPPPATVVLAAWERQSGAVRNAVVRIVAAEPAVAADPNRLLDGLRWVDLGTTADGGRQLALEAARQERIDNELFGFLPTTSQRLAAVERIGTAELRAVPVGSGLGPFGPVVAWRLIRIEVAGEALVGG